MPDSAIDLGIALESLLLEGDNPSELSFRIALRGAWLAGKSVQERKDTFVTLQNVYTLRSIAAHTGFLEESYKKKLKGQDRETRSCLDKGQSLCRELIKKVALANDIDWNSLVLGEAPVDSCAKAEPQGTEDDPII